MRIVLITIFAILGLSAKAQQCHIQVRSYNDSLPIPYSHICIEQKAEKSYAATDVNGKISVATNPNCILSVSSMGYEAYVDTLALNEGLCTVYLKAKYFTTDAVVITGQYKAMTRDKSIYSIKVIDNRQIEQLASNNLAELLNHELNVKINNDPSTGSSIQLQGVSGENIKILIDGVPLIGRLDGDLDLSQINLEDVEHIEIVEGPMSVAYGSNALGGVINIITKENAYAKFSSGIKTYYESVGQYNLHGHVHVKKNKHSLRFNGGRKFFSGYSLSESVRAQTWKPKEQYNLGGHYIYNGKKNVLKLKSDYFDEALWNKGNLLAPYFEKAYDTWFYTQRFNNSIHYNHLIDSTMGIDVLASHSYYQRMSNKYIKDLTNLSQNLTDNDSDHDTIRFNTFVLRSSFSRTHPSLKFHYQAGIDFNYEVGDGKRINGGGDAMGDFAFFGSVQYKISQRWMAQAGLRMSHNTKYDAPQTPSLNIKYKHGKSNYRFSYSRGFRAPSIKELNLYFYDSNHQIEGNKDLKAESSHNFMINYAFNKRFKKQALELNTKVFHNRIDDMIALVQVDPDNALHFRNENIGEFQNLGSELTVIYSPFNQLKLRAGASLIGSKDASFNEEAYVYSSIIGGGVNYSIFKNKVNLVASYKFFGKTPYYQYIDEEVSLSYSESYHNLDLNINAHFFHNRLTLAIGAKNLFDNTTIGALGSGSAHGGDAASLVGWGRTFFASAAYKFIKY